MVAARGTGHRGAPHEVPSYAVWFWALRTSELADEGQTPSLRLSSETPWALPLPRAGPGIPQTGLCRLRPKAGAPFAK